MNPQRSVSLLSGLCLLVLLASHERAVAEQPVPTPAQLQSPQSIGELEQQAAPGRPATEGERKGQPSVVKDVEVDHSAQPKPESQLQSPTFQLKGIRIVGNQTLPSQEIIDVVKPHLDRQVTSEDLKRIATHITELLTSKGYVTSRCLIPAQTVTDGHVVLQIDENKLGKIQLGGPSSYRYDTRLFHQHLHDLIGQIIHLETLNSRLKLLSKLPGTRIEPTLQKAPDGFSNLFLKITDFADSHTVTFHNQASRYTGEYNARYVGTLYNVTGAGDSLSAIATANPFHPDYSNSLGLNYLRPFGEKGGLLQLSLFSLRYELDPDRVGTDEFLFEGDSTVLFAHYEKPFLVDVGDFWWGVGVEKKITRAATRFNTYFDTATIDYRAGDMAVEGEDNLTVGEFSLRATVLDTWLSDLPAANSASMKIKHAFPGVLGSMTDDDIRWKQDNLANSSDKLNIRGPVGNVEGMDPDFWKLYLAYSRTQMLPYRLSAVLLLEAEATPSDKIPSAYDFVGAGNGASGYRYSIGVGRPLYEDLLNMTVGFRSVTAIKGLWNENPGCGETTQMYGSYRCTTNTGFVNLAFKYGLFFSDLEYQTTVYAFEQNQEQLKVNLGARW
ncbi:MAG: ShlB/FhaC/HecB family hemolysin secretion/activation protein [Magnetococcales bacterium]|nr:ShlB/FhaC/HecB family hemolysin secretion/activation protein [Magnetococcales bacterium]